MMKKYVVGIDYGTLSARALLIDVTTGAETAVSEYVYPHAILPRDYFAGIQLDKEAALQHPQDYLDALQFTMNDIREKAGISTEEIVGLGIDCTASSFLPVTEDGTPLCFLDTYKNEPHAYIKLWKHHGGQAEADEITAMAEACGESWLAEYGGKVSSEWMFPKILETLHKAPELYAQTARFVEVADWLVWQLTGTETHSSCMAGYKSFWNKRNGYPSNEFWGRLHPDMSDLIGTKISETVIPTGSCAGEIGEFGAALTGLAPGTRVAAPIIDAHAALPAAGIVDAGKLMVIIGTSSCHIVMSEDDHCVSGICGRVEDGVVPGYVAYEAGQSCVGDSFAWFVNNCVPERYTVEAREKGMNIFRLLTEKAERLQIGESGLLVLDWWNGNRSPLADFDLSGLILGLTLQTKPEEIYRALLEGTAFGTKVIVDRYEENGVAIDEIYVAGGIPRKDPFMMQIYADVLGKELRVAGTTQAGAKGSAIFAAAASGCFGSIQEAAARIADPCDRIYTPNPENTEKYRKLYEEYRTLLDYFGNGGNHVMKRLKNKK